MFDCITSDCFTFLPEKKKRNMSSSPWRIMSGAFLEPAKYHIYFIMSNKRGKLYNRIYKILCTQIGYKSFTHIDFPLVNYESTQYNLYLFEIFPRLKTKNDYRSLFKYFIRILNTHMYISYYVYTLAL